MRPEALGRYFLYATVFTTGAAVLVIEVTAVRILAPFFGSSLFVLSSVLTVILGALSFGYYIGGRISDRFPVHEPLYTVITTSGLSVLLLELVALHALPAYGTELSVVSGPLIFSLLLFFIPALLLGIVSPYVIKLQSVCTQDEQLGSVVGATFFWGTVGSIVGSLLSGFALIPLFGLQQSIVGTGIVLVLLGILGRVLLAVVTERQSVHALVAHHGKFIALSVILALMLFSLLRTFTIQPEGTVLFEADGLYSHILVYEGEHAKGTLRALKRDRNNSSATLLNSHDLIFGYSQFAEYYPRLQEETENFLLIGGGAYSMPRTLVARDPEIVVDVVEIEPLLFTIARRYFDVRDTERINNFVMDGRMYLVRSEKEYDVIFGDAFGTDLGVPAHLTTREFLEEVRASLSEDGIYMLNYIGSLATDAPTLTGSMVKTLSSVFPNLKMYAFNKPNPHSTQNIVFVARNGEASIDFGEQTVTSTGGETFLVNELEVPISRFDLDNELLLTDDRAPVEYLMARQLN